MSKVKARQPCLSHAGHWVTIREDLLAVCEGKQSPAIVLAILEAWTDTLRNQKEPPGDDALWVYRTYPKLIADSCGLIKSRQPIADALTYLKARGFVEVRSNPDHKWDHKTYYRLDLTEIQKALDGLADRPSIVCQVDGRQSSSQTNNRTSKRTTERETTETAAAAGADPEVDREVYRVTESDSPSDPHDTVDGKAVTAFRESEALDAKGVTRLKAFIDLRATECCKAGYEKEDEANPDWITAFGTIVATDDEFSQALETAFTSRWLNDENWGRIMRGPNAAQQFASSFAKLLRHELPNVGHYSHYGPPPRAPKSSGQSKVSGRAKQQDWRTQPKPLTPEQAEVQAEVQAGRELADLRRAENESKSTKPNGSKDGLCPTPGCGRQTPGGCLCSLCKKRAKEVV